MELPSLRKRARFLYEPPPNFGFPPHMCHVQIHLHRLLQAARIVANLDETANKTGANQHTNILTASRRTRKSVEPVEPCAIFFDESN